MDLAAATGAPIIRNIGGQEYRFKLMADKIGELLETIRNQRREAEKKLIREAIAESGEALTAEQWLEKLRAIDNHGVGLGELYGGLASGMYVEDMLVMAIDCEKPRETIKGLDMPFHEKLSLCSELLGIKNMVDDESSAEGKAESPEPTETG